MDKRNKYNKPVKIELETDDFDEVMKRISNVNKSQVEANIKKNKQRKQNK